MKRISLFTLLAFGCATVRVPVTPLGEPADAPGAIAPPLTELWLESSDAVSSSQQMQAEQQARAALASALQQHEISAAAMGAADAVLFVRERAVGLTDARRSQQTWAKVGIVVGIVVVIAVVVIAAVATKNHDVPVKSPSHAAAPAARAAGVPVRPLPTAHPVAPAAPAVATLGHTSPLPHYAPRGGSWPRAYQPDFPIFFYFDFWLPPRPLVLAPEGEDEPTFAPEPMLAPLSDDQPPPDAEEPPAPAAAEPGPPPPPPPPSMELPPLGEPADFVVQDRGFFAGPKTAVQLDLIDRATGRLLWSRAVAEDSDPLDGAAVSSLIDEALDGQPWARRTR